MLLTPAKRTLKHYANLALDTRLKRILLDRVDRKMWALDLLEGCDSSDVHHGMVPCKLTFKIQQSCVSYSIDYWGTTVWKLLIPSKTEFETVSHIL